MRIITLLLLVVCHLTYSQTKDETIDWLNRSLENYGDNSIMGTYQISTKIDDNYGEYLIFTKTKWNSLLGRNVYYYYTFSPNAISDIYLSGKGRTNQTLDIYLTSKSNGIFENDKEEFISEIDIRMKNGYNEMTKRIHTGLLHLFKEMGHKIEEQKDLFKN